MRAQKILKRLAIIFMIVCIVFIAIDLLKVLTINFNFLSMQSADRISSSSNADEIRYEPTDYVIVNKEDALEEIKKITLDLKNEYINSNNKEELFEIANINKIENFFYEYQKYAVVKYKLLNIIEDLPKIYKATSAYTNAQVESYFNENSVHIDNYYGITSSEQFIDLARSLSFLKNSKVEIAIVQVETIDFDYDNDTLTFNMELIADNDKSSTYFVKAQYYKTSDNQVTPYVTFTVNE